MARILMPLPARDFDPTEAAVPWRVLSDLGHDVRFATPDGRAGTADPIMLDGRGLDPWGRVPVLRRVPLVGLMLRADAVARHHYRALIDAPAFRRPLRWDEAGVERFNALVLPGGHRARGMRDYLESPLLHQLTAAFLASGRPVGAICHGVVLAARAQDAAGRSVLSGRTATALTWRLESSADRIARIGRWWDRCYYRTYREAPGEPVGYRSVEQEVRRALGPTGVFLDVPPAAADARRKTSGLVRDRPRDTRAAWVVVDGNLVTARWPGDAHLFAQTLDRVIDERGRA